MALPYPAYLKANYLSSKLKNTPICKQHPSIAGKLSPSPFTNTYPALIQMIFDLEVRTHEGLSDVDSSILPQITIGWQVTFNINNSSVQTETTREYLNKHNICLQQLSCLWLHHLTYSCVIDKPWLGGESWMDTPLPCCVGLGKSLSLWACVSSALN